MSIIENYFSLKSKIMTKCEWLLYSWFGIKRTKPCGKNDKNSYICRQPLDTKHCYISSDRKRIYCKCCNKIRIRSEQPIEFNNSFGF